MPLLSTSKSLDCPSAAPNVHAQNVLKECDTIIQATKRDSSRRSPSISSSSSFSSCSSSNFPDDLPSSPATPLRFSGIPFSWEHLPGIPKNLSHEKMDSTSAKVLPLPPPHAFPQASKRFNLEETGIRKKISSESFKRDPFFAALVECSKDDDDHEESTSNFWNGTKVSRSISDRFGFINLYTSCKRTCAVSESIVYLPRSSRENYDLITRRRSR